ncbi:MAG TPA: FAD-dependent monooxygenase [Solirubrobacteraceae bacterium]|nr:FAD-dependent monooxygenase [Solirubrobacteraceae bacterium]
MNITCVGGGPSGLYFAILAARDGHAVTVLERLPEDDVHGWGVTFPEDLLDELRANDPESAEQIAAVSYLWSGQVVFVQGRPSERVGEGGGHAIGRRAMRDVFLARARQVGVDVRFEHPVENVTGLTDQDLVVGSDGVNSAVRRAYEPALGTAIDRGRNKYVWLGTDRPFPEFTDIFVQTPVGWIWAHAYGFEPSMSTFIVAMAPETWHGLGLGELPTEDTMRRLEELFAEHLDGHSLLPQSGTGHTLPWLEFQRVTNESWHAGNVVLVGDAAHTTHFSIGSGTRLALEDVLTLAGELRANDALAPALAAYGERRAAEVRGTQRQALHSARWFEEIPRYIGRDRFGDRLTHRFSSFQSRLSPSAYLRLIDVADRMPAIVAPARALVRAWRRRNESVSRGKDAAR